MNQIAYCPKCQSEQPHRHAADEPGDMLWCRTCRDVHPEAKETCDECHFWDLGRCWHTSAMLGVVAEPGLCANRRARRAIPPPPIDF